MFDLPAATVGPRSEPAAKPLRIATYNVHGCVGMDGKRSEARIAAVIGECAADIVGVQELDLSRKRSGGVDQSGLIAAELGWHRYFHPAMRRGDEHYGDAILSRFPLSLRRAGDLPGVAPFFCRETRGAIAMDAETPLGRLRILNTHFGLGFQERLRQAEAVGGVDWIGIPLGDAPVVLLGDFNSLPGSRPYGAITRRLNDVRTLLNPGRALRTYPTWFPFLAIDHIFVSENVRVRAVEVHRTPLARVASDHFPLVAEVAIESQG